MTLEEKKIALDSSRSRRFRRYDRVHNKTESEHWSYQVFLYSSKLFRELLKSGELTR